MLWNHPSFACAASHLSVRKAHSCNFSQIWFNKSIKLTDTEGIILSHFPELNVPWNWRLCNGNATPQLLKNGGLSLRQCNCTSTIKYCGLNHRNWEEAWLRQTLHKDRKQFFEIKLSVTETNACIVLSRKNRSDRNLLKAIMMTSWNETISLTSTIIFSSNSV